MDNYYFLDTCVVLNGIDQFIGKTKFYISEHTIRELEYIKTSRSKDDSVKYRARHAVRLLDKFYGDYQIVCFTRDIQEAYELDDDCTVDEKIISSAAHIFDVLCAKRDISEFSFTFVTDDVLCKFLAKKKYLLHAKKSNELQFDSGQKRYKGYVECVMTAEELQIFMCNLEDNKFNLAPNQYLLVMDLDGVIRDKFVWTGKHYEIVQVKKVNSTHFSGIEPKDAYQAIAMDSIYRNTFTVLSGKAGSGKSLMALAVSHNLIKRGTYERIVILHNPTSAKGAAQSGYLPGTATEKGLSSSIGNMLISKYGDRSEVDRLILEEKIRLISMEHCRGTEILDTEILYISEAQNMSVELMKLCLSRASQGCKIILEGDHQSQVDSYAFEGFNNGLQRVIDALKGDELFGYVHLPNVHRSKIAELVQKL